MHCNLCLIAQDYRPVPSVEGVNDIFTRMSFNYQASNLPFPCNQGHSVRVLTMSEVISLLTLLLHN